MIGKVFKWFTFYYFFISLSKKNLNIVLNEKEDFSKKLGITNINK